MASFLKAFGLSDNPFGPSRPLAGIKNVVNMKDLATRPLRVHKEPALIDLFVPGAGLFEQHLAEFTNLLEQDGYCKETQQMGLSSSAYLIGGQTGSGKTTLVNVFVKHLLECQNEMQKWKFFSCKLGETVASQAENIAEFKKELKGGINESDYCCVVIDNVLSDVETAALGVYSFLQDLDCFVIFFIVTRDLKLIKKNWLKAAVPIKQFRARPLSPEQGLELVRSRIQFFRADEIEFEEFPLFPFKRTDILNSLNAGFAEIDGAVTIRQLNSTLYRVLREKAAQENPDFDISQVPQNRISEHIIELMSAYKRLLAA